ncbi:MAG: hypothetical protein ACHP7O_04710 [Burkholderiales bacterium]
MEQAVCLFRIVQAHSILGMPPFKRKIFHLANGERHGPQLGQNHRTTQKYAMLGKHRRQAAIVDFLGIDSTMIIDGDSAQGDFK